MPNEYLRFSLVTNNTSKILLITKHKHYTVKLVGRTPILKNGILMLLEEAKAPLRLSELREELERKLNRKIHPEAIAAALKTLAKEDWIAKKLVHGKIAYELSNQYHKQSVRNLLARIIESFRIEELEANFIWGKERLPNVVYISPSPKNPHETASQSDMKMSVDVDWQNPSSGISSIICNDYLLLPSNVREGLTNLILWSYWIAIQEQKRPHKVYGAELDSIESRLKDCLKFSSSVLKKAKERSDNRRIQAEEAIIRILNITLELLKKENLVDFLEYANENKDHVKKEEDTILATQGHFMASGERIFHNIAIEKSDMVFYGLSSIEEKIDKVVGLKSIFKEPELSLDSAVWNEFVHFLIDVSPPALINQVKGSFELATKKAKGYLRYLNDLIGLVRRRQMMAIYLWNVPVKKESEKYLKLPMFEEWFKALKMGQLSHRIWLFEEDALKKMESAYRAVKRGKRPEPWKIDKEFWTLRDLYELHPKGKSPEFWQEILTALRTHKGEEPYRGGPVPKEFYYKMIEKEKDALKEFIARREDE
jgi:DNA-binding HxlR family transcriptional regulator